MQQPIIGSNRFFKESYVINLSTRKDRYIEFEHMIRQHNVGNITRFDAVLNKDDGAAGCAASHIGVIKLAKERGLENVLIFEDDAIFVNNFEGNINSVLSELSFNKWGMFYLGCRLISPASKVSKHIAKTSGAYTTHAYAVHHSLYDTILSYKTSPLIKAIDVFYSIMAKNQDVYCAIPNLVSQRPSVSDIIGRHIDYTEMISSSFIQHLT
jgi:GR25 family glycosyltransferase involved in LPS biosynthesis